MSPNICETKINNPVPNGYDGNIFRVSRDARLKNVNIILGK